MGRDKEETRQPHINYLLKFAEYEVPYTMVDGRATIMKHPGDNITNVHRLKLYLFEPYEIFPNIKVTTYSVLLLLEARESLLAKGEF